MILRSMKVVVDSKLSASAKLVGLGGGVHAHKTRKDGLKAGNANS